MKMSELIFNLETTITNLKKLPQDKEVMSSIDQGGYSEGYKRLDVDFVLDVDEDEDINVVYFTILLGRE